VALVLTGRGGVVNTEGSRAVGVEEEEGRWWMRLGERAVRGWAVGREYVSSLPLSVWVWVFWRGGLEVLRSKLSSYTRDTSATPRPFFSRLSQGSFAASFNTFFHPHFLPLLYLTAFHFFLSARRFVDFQDKRRCRLGSISKSDFSSVFCLKEKGEPWPPFLLAGQCYTVVQKIRIGLPPVARDRPLLAVAGYDEASVPASVGSDHCSISMWAKRCTSRAVSHRKR
jgi:hypothetical protein